MDIRFVLNQVNGNLARRYGVKPAQWDEQWPEAAVYIMDDGSLIYRAHPQDAGWRYVPNYVELVSSSWYVTDMVRQ